MAGRLKRAIQAVDKNVDRVGYWSPVFWTLVGFFGGGAAVMTWLGSQWESLSAHGWAAITIFGIAAAACLVFILSFGAIAWRYFNPLPNVGSQIPVSYEDSKHSDDAAATAPDRQSYYDLISFISGHLLPACDALIDLQKALVESAAPGSPMRDLAIAGLRSGSSSNARDFWRNYFALEQQINQSEPTLRFSEMIRCIRALELRGYSEFRAETAAFARQFDDATRKCQPVAKAADEWVIRHNSLVQRYEDIRNDPRFSGQNTDGGSLFWPRKRNGFGTTVARRDQLVQLDTPGPNSRKALE